MIKCDPSINFGQPALVGHRLTAYDIVTKLYYENSVNITTEEYSISKEDLREAIDYCKNLKCKKDKGRLHYCDGCLLRTIEEGWKFNKNNYEEFEKVNSKIVISKDNTITFLGSLQELEDSEFGKVTWLIANEMNKKFDF